MQHLSTTCRLLMTALCIQLWGGEAMCGDWPQILGLARNGVAQLEKPVSAWGDTGPTAVWSSEVGEGFAGPAVLANRVVVFHRVGGNERIEARAADSGESLWRRDFPSSYTGRVNPDSGPRCVPLIHDGSVFLFGAAGDLHCVRLADGEPQWSVDAYDKLRGDEGFFGAGSTPIVCDGRLIVNVGGRRAGLAAFDLKTGEILWQATNERASYSSPTNATLGGREAAVFVTQLNTVAIDPRDGRVLFQFPFGARGSTVNAATPLVFGNSLFVSSSYGVGAKLARINRSSAEVVWENDSVMSSQYTTCVYHDGFLFGAHGREDYKTGELRCLEAASGKLRWKAPQVGVAHTILVGDRLLALNVSGKLHLVEATPAAYRPLAEATLSTQTTRALPAFSNGRLFIRDSSRLRCFQLTN